MARARKPPRVEVVWLDAATTPGPLSRDEAIKKATLVERHTLGYVVDRDEKRIVVAQTFDPESGEFDDVTTIPAPWVIRRRKRK